MLSEPGVQSMERCSMKRKWIISDTLNSLVSATTRRHAPWPKNMQARVEDT